MSTKGCFKSFMGICDLCLYGSSIKFLFLAYVTSKFLNLNDILSYLTGISISKKARRSPNMVLY